MIHCTYNNKLDDYDTGRTQLDKNIPTTSLFSQVDLCWRITFWRVSHSTLPAPFWRTQQKPLLHQTEWSEALRRRRLGREWDWVLLWLQLCMFHVTLSWYCSHSHSYLSFSPAPAPCAFGTLKHYFSRVAWFRRVLQCTRECLSPLLFHIICIFGLTPISMEFIL